MAEVRAALPPDAEDVRLHTGALMPAFIDAHQHAYLVAADPHTDALYRKASEMAGLLGVIRSLAIGHAGLPQSSVGTWRRFHGYEPLRLRELRSPTAAELDTVCPDMPLHVITRTFHESAVNSAGLDALGIGRTTPDPPGGRIVRDRRGRPTGVLLEAVSFSAEVASRAAEDAPAWQARLAAHAKRLLSHGITRIGDAAVPAHTARDFVMRMAESGVDVHPLLIGHRIDEPVVVPGGTTKVLADGGEYCHLCMTGRQVRAVVASAFRAGFGREGALARAVGNRAGFPHRERDGRWHSGVRFPHEAGLAALLRRAADAGASGVAVHTSGNGSVDAVLRAMEADRGLRSAAPIRIEHAVACDPELAGRIAALGTPVVAQPVFLSAFGHELNLVPVPRPLKLMPFRMLVDAGVQLVFSSDYPAADLSPWQGIAAAVTRCDATGQPVHPEEAVDVATALDAYTRKGAQVLGLRDVGTLEIGTQADMTWCDADPYAISPHALGGIAVLATWRSGELLHSAPGGRRPLT